jgi:hypothetical protein
VNLVSTPVLVNILLSGLYTHNLMVGRLKRKREEKMKKKGRSKRRR